MCKRNFKQQRHLPRQQPPYSCSCSYCSSVQSPPLAPQAVTTTRVLLQHNPWQPQTQNAVVGTSCLPAPQDETKEAKSPCSITHMAPNDHTVQCTVPAVPCCTHALHAQLNQPCLKLRPALPDCHRTCHVVPHCVHDTPNSNRSSINPKGHNQTPKNAQAALPGSR
jgi:hypothetical protein